MKKMLFISFLFCFFFAFSQNEDPLFKDFKYRKIADNFQPVFKTSGPISLTKKEISFRINSPAPKPVFCRMEDNISNHYNVMFQLRAGSDQDYRRIAFPKKVEKSSKYIE